MKKKILESGVDILSEYQVSPDGRISYRSWVVRPAGLIATGCIFLAGILFCKGIGALAETVDKKKD